MSGYSTGIFPTTAGQGGGAGGPTFVPSLEDLVTGAAFSDVYTVQGGPADETVYIPVFRAGILSGIRTNVAVNTLTTPTTISAAVNGIDTGNMVSYLPGELGLKFIAFSVALAAQSRISLIVTPGVGGGFVSLTSSLEYRPL